MIMRNEEGMVSVGRLPNACFEARFLSTIRERLGFAAGIFYSRLRDWDGVREIRIHKVKAG